jgi:aspartyl-tRNA synthetase
MVSGFERYFQIAKCFRDEDLRADRQPEFTQVDVECSFIDEDEIMDLGEKLIASVFKKVKNIDVKLPLQKMKYVDAIEKYGSDKPDLRFGMQINDITDKLLPKLITYSNNNLSYEFRNDIFNERDRFIFKLDTDWYYLCKISSFAARQMNLPECSYPEEVYSNDDKILNSINAIGG